MKPLLVWEYCLYVWFSALILGGPLCCAYLQFGSWWKAVGLLVACVCGVLGFVFGGAYLQRKAGW